MRIESQNQFALNSMLVPLWDDESLSKLREAGRCFARQMKLIKSLIDNKTDMTTLEISRMVGQNIRDDGFIPTFKNYRIGSRIFPEDLCVSVNRELVHGIGKNCALKEGDVVSFDFGVTNDEAIVDACRTFIYGEPQIGHTRLLETTRLCLDNAIKSISLDKHLGCIGHAIYTTARNKGYKVIEQFGGHMISPKKVHSAPFISNRANTSDGIRFVPNMVLAIEPLLVPYTSSTETKTAGDNWTVVTEEIGCHFEDSIYIHKDGDVEVLTKDIDEN